MKTVNLETVTGMKSRCKHDMASQRLQSYPCRTKSYQETQRSSQKFLEPTAKPNVVPRAENFGDLITADHKVLSEGCQSRDNHRYARLGHPMDPVVSVKKNKNFSGNRKEFAKVLGAD